MQRDGGMQISTLKSPVTALPLIPAASMFLFGKLCGSGHSIQSSVNHAEVYSYCVTVYTTKCNMCQIPSHQGNGLII